MLNCVDKNQPFQKTFSTSTFWAPNGTRHFTGPKKTSISRPGRGSGCVKSIYRSYTLCIRPDSEPTTLLYHPKQKPRRGGPQTDKHLPTYRQVPLQVNFKEKPTYKFGVY